MSFLFRFYTDLKDLKTDLRVIILAFLYFSS